MNTEKKDNKIIQVFQKEKKNKSIFDPLIYTLREVIAVLFWIYLITKVFIFDFDNYFISKHIPQVAWILNYKFVIFLTILASLWLIITNKKILPWFLYILFYPFVLILWRTPRVLYSIGSWSLAIAVINSFLSFFKSIKYNFIVFSIIAISTIIILATDNKILILLATFLVFIILATIFFDRFWAVFKPTLIYQIHLKIISHILDFTKKTWAIDKKIQSLSVVQMSETQLQKWTGNLQAAIIGNKMCYFLSSKLRDYQKSKINVIFSVFSIIILLMFTVFIFALINYGIYKVYPNSFHLNGNETDYFTFFYYSFNVLHFNTIPEIIPIENFSRMIYILEQFFAIILIGIFITLFFSVKNERESKEIDEAIDNITKEGDAIGSFIESEYKLSIEDAIIELEKLKAGMIKIIYFLSKNINPY